MILDSAVLLILHCIAMLLPVFTTTGSPALNVIDSPLAEKLEIGNHLSENKETFEIG